MINMGKILGLNHNIFSAIDVEDKAYWLGYMYGDGWITGNRFGMESKDKEHVEKFRDFLDSEHKIITRIKMNNEYTLIQPTSKQVARSLRVLGYKDKIPDIREDLIKHFIRGLFDADGCLTNDRKWVRIHLTGIPNIIKHIQDYFIEIGILKTKTKLYDHGKVVTMSYSCKQAESFLNYIYDDCKIYLDRKQEKYEEVCN